MRISNNVKPENRILYGHIFTHSKYIILFQNKIQMPLPQLTFSTTECVEI